MTGMQKTHGSEVFLAKDMRQLEKHNFLKNKSFKFMKKAGHEVFRLIKKKYKKKQAAIVLCGPGNNGGDGFIVAGHLLKEGYNTKVYTLSQKDKYTGDALLALKNFKGQVKSISFLKIIPNSFIIDALFGIGLKRKIGGRLKNIIKLINKSNNLIIYILFY